MNSKTSIFGFLIIAAVIAAVSFVAINKFSKILIERNNNEARFHCAEMYRYTKTQADGSVVSYPMDIEYRNCISQIGL